MVKKIGDKNYILIGNETQLRAIGTDTDVTEPIWRVYETREKKPGILGGALSGYTAWKPAADTGPGCYVPRRHPGRIARTGSLR